MIAAGRTTEYSAALVKQKLDQDRTPILGTVLNRVEAQKNYGYYDTASTDEMSRDASARVSI